MDAGEIIAGLIGGVSGFLLTQLSEILKHRRQRKDEDRTRTRTRLDELDVAQERLLSTLKNHPNLATWGKENVAQVPVLVANLALNTMAERLGDESLARDVSALSDAFQDVMSEGDFDAFVEKLELFWKRRDDVVERASVLRARLG